MGLFKSKVAKEGDKQKGSKESAEGNAAPPDPAGKGGNHGNKGTTCERKLLLIFSFPWIANCLRIVKI